MAAYASRLRGRYWRSPSPSPHAQLCARYGAAGSRRAVRAKNSPNADSAPNSARVMVCQSGCSRTDRFIIAGSTAASPATSSAASLNRWLAAVNAVSASPGRLPAAALSPPFSARGRGYRSWRQSPERRGLTCPCAAPTRCSPHSMPGILGMLVSSSSSSSAGIGTLI